MQPAQGGGSPHQCWLPCWSWGCSRHPSSQTFDLLSFSEAQRGEGLPTPPWKDPFQAPRNSRPFVNSQQETAPAPSSEPLQPTWSQLHPSAFPLRSRASPGLPGDTWLQEGGILDLLSRQSLVNPGSQQVALNLKGRRGEGNCPHRSSKPRPGHSPALAPVFSFG